MFDVDAELQRSSEEILSGAGARRRIVHAHIEQVIPAFVLAVESTDQRTGIAEHDRHRDPVQRVMPRMEDVTRHGVA